MRPEILKLKIDSAGADTQLHRLFPEMFSVVAIALITVVLALVAVDSNTTGRLAEVRNS